MPTPPRIFTPPSPKPVPLNDRDVQQAISNAADVSGATYFQSKMTQPDWRQITFNGELGIYTVNDPWYGSWDPQSILLVNPLSITVWVSANGSPVGSGLPFPPDTPGLRLPISGQQGALVLGVDPTALGDDSGTVHLFRYATPD